MIYPVFELFGIVHILILLVLFLSGTAVAAGRSERYHEQDRVGSGTLFIGVWVAVTFLFANWMPTFQVIYYLLGYLLVGFIWAAVFWILRLQQNREKLQELLSKTTYSTIQKEDIRWDLEIYGTEVNGKWLPNHPTKTLITSNVLVWPFHVAARIFNDLIYRLLLLVMDRVRNSFAVEVQNE